MSPSFLPRRKGRPPFVGKIARGQRASKRQWHRRRYLFLHWVPWKCRNKLSDRESEASSNELAISLFASSRELCVASPVRQPSPPPPAAPFTLPQNFHCAVCVIRRTRTRTHVETTEKRKKIGGTETCVSAYGKMAADAKTHPLSMTNYCPRGWPPQTGDGQFLFRPFQALRIPLCWLCEYNDSHFILSCIWYRCNQHTV